MSDPVTAPAGVSFAALLRRLRLAAGLSQEALAERAGLSDRAVSALERGVNRRPHLETVRLLAEALDLAPEQRAALLAAARPESMPAAVTQTADDLAPAGTLTFLLTDIEGSTALWERQEAQMRTALVRHDALLDELLARHGGRRIKDRGEGDSIFAVFADPASAVAAALAIQRALLAEHWPAGSPLRVRMGLHTGIALLHGGDYYGPVVNRAARIRDLGHGGQVLLAEATAALVEGHLPEGVSLRDLGRHRLRGIEEPQAIYQICHPDLPADFPPPGSPRAPRHNLPEALSGLVGREAEQAAVLAALGASRLVTLIGAGGVGKTRLALSVAGELVDQFADGVWLVELAGLAESAVVPGAVAGALGMREETGQPMARAMVEYLRERRLLLVLDNCEHLADACAGLVETLLRACPRLRILATSREGLGVAGERLYRVPSLPVPDPAALPPPEELGRVAAVRLFVERAGAREAGFALTEANAALVAGICRRLEGIPLAIELAAGRVGSLPLGVIAARLEQSLGLLAGGPRTAPSRQRTMRGALDWSWDLLAEEERALLCRLSVFAGGCTLAAAEAVCGDGGTFTTEAPQAQRHGGSTERAEVAELLAALVGKSLALLEERAAAEARYGLLEPVRQYAQERLGERDEAETLLRRHAAYFLTLAEEAAPELTGPRQVEWLARLALEHDNLRAALRWSQQQGETEMGLRLAGALWRFWYMRGYLSEGRRWLDAVLAAAEHESAATTAAARATALAGAGILASIQGDHDRAAALLQSSLHLRRELGDQPGIAASLQNLATVAYYQGAYDQAVPLYEESLALHRALHDRQGIALALNNLGTIAEARGSYREAAALLEESLSLARALGGQQDSALALFNLGSVLARLDETARATALLEESLALYQELEDKLGMVYALQRLGEEASRRDQAAQAEALHRRSLTLARELGQKEFIAWNLEGLAAVAMLRWRRHPAISDHASLEGRDAGAGVPMQPPEHATWPARAAKLLGAAAALRLAINTPIPPVEQPAYARLVEEVRGALGGAAFAAAWDAGQATPPEAAVADAIGADPR